MISVEKQIEAGLLQTIAASVDIGGEWLVDVDGREEGAEVVQSQDGVFVDVPVSDPVSGNPVKVLRYRVRVSVEAV